MKLVAYLVSFLASIFLIYSNSSEMNFFYYVGCFAFGMNIGFLFNDALFRKDSM